MRLQKRTCKQKIRRQTCVRRILKHFWRMKVSDRVNEPEDSVLDSLKPEVGMTFKTREAA
jgi:hypothetical protein